MKHKSFSRTLAALLSVMLIVGLLPTTVFAANTATVKINGQELQDGVPVRCGEGTIKFDSANNTLTLDNATISESNADQVLRIQGYGESVTVNLLGNNKISSTSENCFPIYIDNADVTIKGTNADILTLESNSDSLSCSFCNLTIDGCILNVTSHNWCGIVTGNGEIIIKNNADITVNSYDISIWGENGIQIADSSVYATANGDGVNTLTSYGDIRISNSTVEAKGTSSAAYPAIYAAGDINVTNKSNVNATSSGMRGIYTDSDIIVSDSSKVEATSNSMQGIYAVGDINVTNKSKVEASSNGRQGIYTESNMTVTDSTVTAASTEEGGIYIEGGTLSLTNSELSAASHPQVYAIVTKHFNVTNSKVTAKGGLLLERGEGDDFSFSITPADGKLAELKVDRNNWDGSAAVHFKEDSESPYDTTVNFDEEDMEKINEYSYVYIGEHIHTGGTADCENPAVCEDCDRPYGNALGHNAVKTEEKAATCTEDGNIEYWHCNACGKYFSDEALTNEIIKDETVVEKTGHGETELKDAKEATCTAEGYTGDKVCKVCGEVLEQGKAIPKVAHSYKDGKCTVCGAADPNYKPDTDSPQTGDSSNMTLWIALLFVSGGVLSAVTYRKKKQLS